VKRAEVDIIKDTYHWQRYALGASEVEKEVIYILFYACILETFVEGSDINLMNSHHVESIKKDKDSIEDM